MLWQLNLVLSMDLDSAQERFVHFLGQLRPDCKIGFLEWVCKEYKPDALESDSTLTEESETPDLLDNIAHEIRSSIQLTALAPGETQLFHGKGKDGDLSVTNTLHVDSFLYPREEDIDKLCSQLDISRSYCLNCGSLKTAPLNFISHSMSREQVQFIFCDLLPDLSGKTVVDVGSRLGVVLYGGFHFSKAHSLIGIEMNPFFCDLQEKVVTKSATKYNMSSRVQVICSDVLDQAEVLASADVIILHNVFEMFCSREEQAKIWEFLFASIRKKGTLIVAVPSIRECWKDLPFQTDLDLRSWAVEVSTCIDPGDEELGTIHLYCVI